VGDAVISKQAKSARSTGGVATARKPVGRADARRQFTLVRDQNGKAVLDWELDAATGADQHLLYPAEGGLATWVERATE
jgi:hypothetical protein